MTTSTLTNTADVAQVALPGGVHLIDLTEQLTYCAGSAVALLVRAGRRDRAASRNPLKDLREAAWFAEREQQTAQRALLGEQASPAGAPFHALTRRGERVMNALDWRLTAHPLQAVRMLVVGGLAGRPVTATHLRALSQTLAHIDDAIRQAQAEGRS